jgi:hypothetical protein
MWQDEAAMTMSCSGLSRSGLPRKAESALRSTCVVAGAATAVWSREEVRIRAAVEPSQCRRVCLGRRGGNPSRSNGRPGSG